jgi:hypothetical protein
MAEYASKGVGVGGLTTGIIGTSLAGLLALNGGDGGLLGGLLGGNNGKMAALMAENTQLKAQVYTDAQVKDVNSEICALRQEVTRQGAEIQCINTKLPLMQEITDGKIARVADAANCGISNLQCSLNCLQQTVNAIVKPFVPASSVTPMPAPLPFPFEPVMKATAEQPTTAASTGA